MSITEVKVIAAIRRWCHNRQRLSTPRNQGHKWRGHVASAERHHDARLVQVIDFELAFALLAAQDQVLLLLAHRDGIGECELADMIGVDWRTIRGWLMHSRLTLATLLEARNAL